MKLRCETGELLAAASEAATIRPDKDGPRQTRMMKISAGDNLLSLEMRDTDTSLKRTLEAEISENGSVLVDPKKFLAVLSSIGEGEISLSIADTEAHLLASSDGSNFSIRCMGADEYPQRPEPPADRVSAAAEDISAALGMVLPAVKNDESYTLLRCVLFTSCEETGTGLRLVATDSYRLAMADIPDCQFSPPEDMLVKLEAAQFLANIKTGLVEIGCSGSEIFLTAGNSDMVLHSPDGTYPGYQQLVPDEATSTEIVKISSAESKQNFLRLLVQAISVSEPNSAVKISIRNCRAELSVEDDNNSFYGSLPVDFTGEDGFSIWFNPRYLADAVRSLPGDEMAMYLHGNLKVALFRGNPENCYLHLLMPIKKSEQS